ncbi:MAG TPA: hypothetical protein VJ761_10815 [Ktedonobacteraceae bacterium]|nr:hypothetical protein [Ktedonobacteraceae bacterium]
MAPQRMLCGCSAQEARCVRGKALLREVGRLYDRLCDPYQVQVVQAVRERWWQEYGQARRVYFAHLGWEVQEEGSDQ